MVVTRLYFEIPEQTSTTSYTIDLASALSRHHRRLIRQKQLFTVYGGIYQDSNDSNAYISTAPHYWVTKRSINRTFKAWRKQLSDAMSESADTQLRTGKYSDFKVHLDAVQNTGRSLHPLDAQGTALPAGEWNYATLTMPREDIEDSSETGWIAQSSDQFDLQIVGQHTSTGSGDQINYSRVGIIKSWLDSRPIKDLNTDSPKENPNMINDPITRMFFTGDSDEDEKIIEAINTENDTAPYDLDKLYGSGSSSTDHGANLQMQCVVSPDTNSGVASIAGFQALCGLVRIVVTGSTGSSGAGIILDVESNGVAF